MEVESESTLRRLQARGERLLQWFPELRKTWQRDAEPSLEALVNQLQSLGGEVSRRAQETGRDLEARAERLLGDLERQAVRGLGPILSRANLASGSELADIDTRLHELETRLAPIAEREDRLEASIEGVRRALDEAIGRVQKQLDDKNFADVLTSAPVVTNQIAELKNAVAEGKSRAEAAMAEAKDMWPKLAEELPKMSEALKAKLDALAKAKKLPEGIDQANLDYSKQGFDEMSKDWAAAQEAFTAGQFTDAASKANAARRRAMDLMARLKVQVAG